MSNDKEKITRKLRAILSADVKGYSLLMADDEIHTIETLKKYRNLMSGLIQQHSGRVVDNPGDNLLAEFSSAVDAVECAVEVQNKLKNENAKFVEDKRLQFRIGINIGDIVQDVDRIFGEGVNIAARIESLADAGGICVSRSTFDQIKNKLQLDTEYLGEHSLKNIKEPVRVYRVLLGTDTPKPLVEEQLELPEKPSIAVLPFDNMSGDPGQEYFSDGLTEQIINGLCKVNNLFVIGRNSSFAYKGNLISTKQIAQELGVKYILEGSIQRAENRVRITAQLLDATTDYHIWSESYDRDLEDLFVLQDEITMKIIRAMEIKLTMGEQARIHEMEINNIQIFDTFARGVDCFNHCNKQDNFQARHIFRQASNLDETAGMFFALIGWTHALDLFFNWSDDPLESRAEMEKNTLKALALNDGLDVAHSLMAYIHVFNYEYDQAIYEAKKAVDLNPNGADAILHLGHITCISGEPKKGIMLINKGFRLNPLPHVYYYSNLGDAYMMNGQYEKAIEVLNQGIMIQPEALNPYIYLAGCYIMLNEFDKAKKAEKKILEIDPNFSFKHFKSNLRKKNQIKIEEGIEHLRKAGLPD